MTDEARVSMRAHGGACAIVRAVFACVGVGWVGWWRGRVRIVGNGSAHMGQSRQIDHQLTENAGKQSQPDTTAAANDSCVRVQACVSVCVCVCVCLCVRARVYVRVRSQALRCVATCRPALRRAALQHIAVCCNMLRCVATCCAVQRGRLRDPTGPSAGSRCAALSTAGTPQGRPPGRPRATWCS